MVSQGKIRRIRRGLFDIPRKHRLLGELSPDPMEVARSVMEGSHARWQASGAYAANLLGLSEQVPAKVVILTDGLAQTISLGKQQVIFRRTSPRNLIGAESRAGLIFQALRHLGKEGVKERHVSHLQKQMDSKTKSALKSIVLYMPIWMQPIIEEIAG